MKRYGTEREIFLAEIMAEYHKSGELTRKRSAEKPPSALVKREAY